jgi:hypothetical protein
LTVLAIALFSLGVFAAIYHPVGTALVIEHAKERGRLCEQDSQRNQTG